MRHPLQPTWLQGVMQMKLTNLKTLYKFTSSLDSASASAFRSMAAFQSVFCEPGLHPWGGTNFNSFLINVLTIIVLYG